MTQGKIPGRTVERSQAVYIVLATYDGAAHLVEQLASIQSQTFTDWRLLVRDDGSHDATASILASVAAGDSRIELIQDDAGNCGAAGNFSRLATRALERGATTVFFADQDDVWFPDKMTRCVERLQVAEARLGPDRPILVHTDLQLIDGDGRVLTQSFMQFQHIHDSGPRALTTLLVQNYVTGCAMAVNRPLLQFGLPVPGEALMHDWWLALCAAACGSIEFVPAATVAYRRHGTNAVSVRGFWQTMNPLRTDWRALWRSGRQHHVRAVRQAAALMRRISEKRAGLNGTATIVDTFIRLHDPRRSAASRIAAARRLGLRSQALPRTLVLYLRLLLWRDS
jgi:rhamnosyltransferase